MARTPEQEYERLVERLRDARNCARDAEEARAQAEIDLDDALQEWNVAANEMNDLIRENGITNEGERDESASCSDEMYDDFYAWDDLEFVDDEAEEDGEPDEEDEEEVVEPIDDEKEIHGDIRL